MHTFVLPLICLIATALAPAVFADGLPLWIGQPAGAYNAGAGAGSDTGPARIFSRQIGKSRTGAASTRRVETQGFMPRQSVKTTGWLPNLLAQPGGCGSPGSDGHVRESIFGAGIGMTSGPSAFLIAVQLEFPTARQVTMGPLLQLGVGDKHTIILAGANIKVSFEMGPGRSVDPFKPFIQGGGGLAYISRDQKTSEDEMGLLLHVGFGFDYYVRPRVSVGSTMNFNIIPTEVLGERMIFSWQLITVRYHF